MKLLCSRAFWFLHFFAGAMEVDFFARVSHRHSYSTSMLVDCDGIRSSFVIPWGVRLLSSSSVFANVASLRDGARCGKKDARRNLAVDLKCTAQEGVGIGIISGERKPSVPVVTEGVGRDEELVGISGSCYESASYQLEISSHDLRLLPKELDLQSESGGDNKVVDGIRSYGDEDDSSHGISTGTTTAEEKLGRQKQPRPKKSWVGVHRRRRMPPQAPWSADEFTQRSKVILESILSESSKDDHLLVEDILNSWLGKITRVELVRLIKDLGFLRQPFLALEVFFWMQKQKGRLKPSPHVYCAIIGMLGRAGMVSDAWEIFNTRKVRDLQSVHIYNSMMATYLKSGSFKKAWKLYEDLCDRGLEADEITFNTLLSGVSNTNTPLKIALELFSKMKLVGITPGRYTYNILITVFSKCRNLEGAAALLEEMRTAKQTPDLCTYNSVIGMYGRAGKYEEALRVYKTLRAAGVFPDVITYTHLMQMFSRAQNPEAAIAQFSEMQMVGCTPDFIIHNLVVHIYARAGLAAEAELAFYRMQKAGFKPNIVTWSSLIQAYGRKGMLEKVGSCFAEMLKSGCRPDSSLFHIMLTAYRQAELPIHAASLFRRMQSQGIQPNAACFNTLIHAFFENGQREDARAWHDQMVTSGFAPDKVSRRLLNNLPPSRGRKSRDLRRLQRLFSIQPLGLAPGFTK